MTTGRASEEVARSGASKPRALVIGAGAVGQPYALHLAKGGCDVTFFLKPSHVDEVADGIAVHRLRRRGPLTERLTDLHVITTVDEVAAAEWDQVWIAVSTPAMRDELLADVLGAIGDATVIVLQQDRGNNDFIGTLVAPEQVVAAEIAVISFQSPLPGRPGPKGIAYYRPSAVATDICGPEDRVRPLADALRRGGMPVRHVDDVDTTTAVRAGAVYCMIATLESHDWKFAGLATSAELRRGLAATRQSLAITAALQPGALPRGSSLAFHLGLWRIVLPVFYALRSWIFPFDIEVYLKYHFSKVGSQVRYAIDDQLIQGTRLGLPVEQLRSLRDALGEAPQH